VSDQHKDDLDPGAYIGHEPELAEETIPGGIGPDDQRVAAHSTQVGPRSEDRPDGHREGPAASDDQVREAGQNR
jgi:hypothetical protein